MAAKFYKLETLGETDEELCVLSSLYAGIKLDAWRFFEGEPMAGKVPADPRIAMDPKWPGVRLSDLLGNTDGVLMVSTRFKELIEKHTKGVPIEYFRFTLLDHRKRVHSKDHWIVNPLGQHDCLDQKKSKIEWDPDEPGEVVRIGRRVLDRRRSKDLPQLFRVKYDPGSYVVGLELAQAMFDLDLTNIAWTELPFGDGA